MPDHVLEGVEDLGHPAAALPLGPDDDPPVLATRGDGLPGRAEAGGPRGVPHPVGVSLQLGLLGPVTVLGLPPDLDQGVAAPGHESLGGGAQPRGPADRIAPDSVGVVDFLGFPGVVGGVGQDGDGAVTGAAHQDQAGVMGRPLNRVHAAVMVDVFVDLGPLTSPFLNNEENILCIVISIC